MCVNLIGRSPIPERQAVIFAAGEINKIEGMDATCGKNFVYNNRCTTKVRSKVSQARRHPYMLKSEGKQATQMYSKSHLSKKFKYGNSIDFFSTMMLLLFLDLMITVEFQKEGTWALLQKRAWQQPHRSTQFPREEISSFG